MLFIIYWLNSCPVLLSNRPNWKINLNTIDSDSFGYKESDSNCTLFAVFKLLIEIKKKKIKCVFM